MHLQLYTDELQNLFFLKRSMTITCGSLNGGVSGVGAEASDALGTPAKCPLWGQARDRRRPGWVRRTWSSSSVAQCRPPFPSDTHARTGTITSLVW